VFLVGAGALLYVACNAGKQSASFQLFPGDPPSKRDVPQEDGQIQAGSGTIPVLQLFVDMLTLPF
jgi:hypothetical protein